MVNPHGDVRPIYIIDARDRIVSVNAAWTAFTAAPDGRTLACDRTVVRQDGWRGNPAGDQLIGRPVWDLVPDGLVRQLWEVLYQRVRAVGAGVFVPMRADTASQRRLIDIELHPLADGSIRHVCEPVWLERRAAVALLDPNYPRDERVLRRCAWCWRIQVRLGAWEEIEEAQRMLAIEAAETLPRLETAVCTTCKQSLLKTFPARVA